MKAAVRRHAVPARAEAAPAEAAPSEAGRRAQPAWTWPGAEGPGPAGPRPPTALYVHVPFCLSVCPYCDFVVYAGKDARGPTSRMQAFVDAAMVEIRLRAAAARQAFGDLPALASVYVGGGTPSLLEAGQLERLLDVAWAEFGLAADAELTMEVNPGRADRGYLRGFRAAGINRLSIGVQSMTADELRRLGRRHSADDVRECVREARRAGFDNLSLDLLYDVPGQSLDSWRSTIAAVLELEPEHISAYSLELAEGGAGGDHLPPSAGALRWRARAAKEQDEDLAAACYGLLDELLAGAGLRWYELSNWAGPGHESRHNLAYWRWLAYEAAGPGAHRFDGARTRSWNAARLDGYLTALLDNHPSLPPGGVEDVDESTALAEQVILALRTRTGLPPELSGLPRFASALSWGRAAGLLEPTPDSGLRLSPAGRLLASELFWRLLPGPLARAG